MLINSDGIIIRIEAKDISVLGRATQGVKIMKVEEETNIISVAKVIKEDELDDEAKEPTITENEDGQIELTTK